MMNPPRIRKFIGDAKMRAFVCANALLNADNGILGIIICFFFNSGFIRFEFSYLFCISIACTIINIMNNDNNEKKNIIFLYRVKHEFSSPNIFKNNNNKFIGESPYFIRRIRLKM